MNHDFLELIHAYLDSELSEQQQTELVAWLRESRTNVERFVAECRLHSELRDICTQSSFVPTFQASGNQPDDEISVVITFVEEKEVTLLPKKDAPASPASLEHRFESSGKYYIPYPDDGAPAKPKIVIKPSPPTPIPWYSVNSPIGLPLISYTLGAIIMLIAIGVGAVVHITHNYEIAAGQAATSEEGSGGGGGLSGALATAEKAKPKKEEAPVVGHISGMVGCRWADPALKPIAPRIRQGTKFALASGLMEITYTTGAKVILQGPCTYEVESPSGGYLALGKLTARVASGEWPVTSAQSPAANHKSAIINHKSHSPLTPSHSPLFTVRTPTALITDLGTEFGVEVDEARNTFSHVFQGKIEIRLTGDVSEEAGRVIVLGENQSARVERSGAHGKPRVIKVDESEAAEYSTNFARGLREPPKYLDLLDIVAGGDGLGNRRERGIDPTTGMEDPLFIWYADGDRRYRPVRWHRLIDGVFVPDGSAGPVQLDSAGHVFDGFPVTDGCAHSSIWARAAYAEPGRRAESERHWIYIMGRGEQFMPNKRGLLGLHPNAGITFSLEAIRRVFPEIVPCKFHAIAGLADARPLAPAADGKADVWVFVDGRLRLKRIGLRPDDRALEVSIPLGPTDRFLTIVSTDGGNGYDNDWVVFGDPVLFMNLNKPQKSANNTYGSVGLWCSKAASATEECATFSAFSSHLYSPNGFCRRETPFALQLKCREQACIFTEGVLCCTWKWDFPFFTYVCILFERVKL